MSWKASQKVEPGLLEVLARAALDAEAAVRSVRASAVENAAAVPWHKLMGSTRLERADGDTSVPGVDAIEGLRGKVVGLYFTASWCGPCHRFSPLLVRLYEQLKGGGAGGFEVVLVGWDDVEAERKTYARNAQMPWLSLPHEPRRLPDELTLRYGIEHIPSLVILEISADGKSAKVLSRDARDEVIRGRADWIERLRGA